MSWITNVNKGMSIRLGDGNTFFPNWMNANRSVEYNISEFNFQNVTGTLVSRKRPMGTRYNIEIFFQGDDNLNLSDEFKKSSEDSRAWQVSHPMYGSLYVQPLSLSFDDRDFNVTRITGQIMETIGAGLVKTSINPVNVIQAKKLDTDIAFARAYEAQIPEGLASDIAAMQDNVTFIEQAQVAYATTTENAQAAVNAYYAANAAIDNAFSDTFTAIRKIQDAINLPATFVNTIGSRVQFLLNNSLELYASITGLTTPNLKLLYENNIAAIVSAMCVASVTNPTTADYRSRGDVLQLIDYISTAYNNYTANLNTLQTDNGGSPDSYIPDFYSQQQLNTLVKFTVSNLFAIAANSKQQRTYTTETNTNAILMAYQFYGLQSDDSTITQVMSDNSIGLNEMLQIKKGRKLIYYV